MLQWLAGLGPPPSSLCSPLTPGAEGTGLPGDTAPAETLRYPPRALLVGLDNATPAVWERKGFWDLLLQTPSAPTHPPVANILGSCL